MTGGWDDDGVTDEAIAIVDDDECVEVKDA
jgi:hypothetical protein